MNKNLYCWDCGDNLVDNNTVAYGGFDSGNYLLSTIYSPTTNKDTFLKCDTCFEADIDIYLESEVA